MELPDKSRAYSELIVDSLRIKNNIINDFVNGPTLTYTGHYDVFRLIDIDAFTVTVTLPERYDKVDVKLVPLSGSIPDDPFVSIDSVTGPAILKKVRNVTVVSPTTITFTTIDGDHFWVTAYGAGGDSPDQWTCEVHPKIVPPNDHGVYSSALTSLMCGTIVMKSTTHDDAVAMARSRPGALIIASATSSTYTVTLTKVYNVSSVNCQPFMFDGKVLVGGDGADYLIDATQTPPDVVRQSAGSPSCSPVPFPLYPDRIVDLKGGYEDYVNLANGFYARRGFDTSGGEYTCRFSPGDWDVLEGSAFPHPTVGKLWVITWTKGLMLLAYANISTDPSAPALVTQTPNDAIAGYASGHVIAAFDRYVFATATGRAPSGDNIIRIDMNDQSVTTLHEEQVGLRVLMDGDTCYGVMHDEGNVGYKVFRCSGDGSFTVGDRIPYGYITAMMTTPNGLLFAYANDAGQGTVSWLDRSTLKLTPATDVSMPDGWETKWKSADAIVVNDTRTVTGRCEMFECTRANGPEMIYFMVANADGDIDEISIPTAVTTARERCVPQPTVLHPSLPLSTSLRSRYGR